MRLALAIEQVIRAHPRRSNQPLEEITTEARRMIDRQPDILVEVKHLHARPVDPRRGHQRLEELDLGGAGRGNDPRPSLRGDDLAEKLRRVPRRGAGSSSFRSM